MGTDYAGILEYHATEERVFDTSNDTVVVTRTLLRESAAQIKRLRTALSAIAEDPFMDPDANADFARKALK